ncbi:MAG: hypothetical protein V7676_04010 [Parasphingorhabdus sp.]|uniref:hypothetical protein n=1 Tax=Parasphingorhabdus sp. TaxID=2709688 RepID=UPI0030036BB6
MIDEFDKLAATIREKANGRQIIYVPNPGNFGDGLIRHATKAFFHDYDIPHLEINVGFRGGKLVLTPALIDNILPASNVDLSLGGNHMSPADIFVHRVAQYECINTDRLHVSIAGCLCNRQVNVVTGSYFKIEAIYNSSMLDQFENVRLFKDAENLLCKTDD